MKGGVMAEDNSSPNNNGSRLIPVRRPLFRTVMIVWAVLETLLVVLGIGSLLAGSYEGYGYLAAALAWLFLSLKRVDTEEYAGIAFFGMPVWITGPGLKLIPWGLLEITYLPSGVIQRQFPEEPELIFKGPDDQPLPQKEIVLASGESITRPMVRVIRVTTAGPEPTKKKPRIKRRDGEDDEEIENELEREILDSRMALEVTFFVRWRILFDHVFDFVINAGGSPEETNRQMRDAGEEQFARSFANRTPGVIIEKFEEIRAEIQKAIEQRVKGWGVQIIQVGWMSPDLGITVSQALRDIPATKAQAIARRIRARTHGYEVATELEGEGEGLKKQTELLGVKPADVLAARVARDSIGKGDVVLGTEGLAQIFGLLKAVKGGMQTPEESTSTPDTGKPEKKG